MLDQAQKEQIKKDNPQGARFVQLETLQHLVGMTLLGQLDDYPVLKWAGALTTIEFRKYKTGRFKYPDDLNTLGQIAVITLGFLPDAGMSMRHLKNAEDTLHRLKAGAKKDGRYSEGALCATLDPDGEVALHFNTKEHNSGDNMEREQAPDMSDVFETALTE